MHERMHGSGDRAPQTPVVVEAGETTVEIRDFDFFPRDLTVQAGTQVSWVNRDSAPHDATDVDGDWATALLRRGDSDSVTFESPGDYEYLCTVHPDMRAIISVV